MVSVKMFFCSEQTEPKKTHSLYFVKPILTYQREKGQHHQEGFRWKSICVQWNVVCKRHATSQGLIQIVGLWELFLEASIGDNSLLSLYTSNVSVRNLESSGYCISCWPQSTKNQSTNQIKERNHYHCASQSTVCVHKCIH